MKIIDTWDELRSDDSQPILAAHAERLAEFEDQPLAELCEFLIIERGDCSESLESKLGQSLQPPPWEYVELVGGWYELVLVTGDDGFGFVVLIEDRPDGNLAMLAYCRSIHT